jgi:hypothetical protein
VYGTEQVSVAVKLSSLDNSSRIHYPDTVSVVFLSPSTQIMERYLKIEHDSLFPCPFKFRIRFWWHGAPHPFPGCGTESELLCEWRSVSQSVSPSWHWAPLGLMTSFWLLSRYSRVRIILQLTIGRSVSQSVSPSWRWPPPGLMTKFWL